MNDFRRWLVLAWIGTIVFYLVATGCASFEFGEIKNRIEDKLDLCPGATIKTIYLDFSTKKREEQFESRLKDILVKNGYELVEDRSRADLELQIKYRSTVKKRGNFGIVFFVPFYNSWDTTVLDIEATFVTNTCARNKTYRVQHQWYFESTLPSDIRQLTGEAP